MITFHASAVCRVRDGYTGRLLEAGGLWCILDGAPVRPLAKPGGYLIFLDLCPGEHCLVLKARGYQEEQVDFHADGGTRELEVAMKPGAGYPFREEVVRAELTIKEGGRPAAGRRLWLAAPSQWELKIAQTRAEAGAGEFRLYRRGPESAVHPGAYLIADGGESEIVQLRRLDGDAAYLAAPLLRSHGRGCPLLPAQLYRTDGGGGLSAVFQAPCTLEIWGEGEGLLAGLPLERGINRREIQLNPAAE